MSAAWLWTQSLWRRHRRATVAIGLLVGIAVGSAMSAWEFSRRAGSAVDRWIEVTQPANAFPEGCPADVDPMVGSAECFGDVMRQRLYDALVGDRLVDGVLIGASLPVTLTAGDRSVPATAVVTLASSGTIERPFIVQGRAAADDIAGEIALTSTAATLLGVELGDLIDARVCDWQYIAPDTPCTIVDSLRVVGLHEPLDSFRPNRVAPPGRSARVSGRGVFAGAATWTVMADGHTPYSTTLARMRDGVAFSDLTDELSAALPGYMVRVGPADNVPAIDALRRRAEVQRATWWIVAAVLAGIAAVFVTQTISRQLHREMTDRDVVRSLGASTSTAAATGAMRNLPTAAIASVAAVIVAVTASRFGPRGLAGRLDLDRGVRWDPTVLTAGTSAIVVGTLVVSAVAATISRDASALRRVGFLPSRLAAATPVVRAGWSLTGAGRRQFVWPAAASLMAVMISVCVASSLSSNLDRTTTEPRSFGVTWDYGLVSTGSGGLTSEEQFGAAADHVANDPIITSGAFVLRASTVGVDGASPFSPIAFMPIKGGIEPVIVGGRAPVADDEIAVGAVTLEELGLHLGDEMPALSVTGRDPDSEQATIVTVGPFQIVGVALISDDDDDVGPGKGVILTADALLTLEPDVSDATVVVNTDHSLTPAAEADHLTDQFGPFLTVPSPQIAITNLSSLGSTPWVITWFLVLLAAAALFHALVNCTSLGAQQLSTLRALGFETAQVRRSVIALTLLVAVPAVALGALVGAIAGTWAWSLVVERVGLAEGGSVSVPAIALAAIAVTAGAVVLSIIPARAAAGRDLVAGLRQD